ncbi:MAG: alpha/beta hydrolase [Chloroflexota bacterium]
MTQIFSAKVGNAKLIGEHAGEGHSLVLLHAGVADRRMWRGQIADLSDSYHVVAYDRRGFGETTTPDEAFSHLEDLRKVLEQQSITKASLIGCSQGSRIAIDFALAYPQIVAELVLIAPAISGAPAPETFSTDVQELIAALDEAEAANDIARVNEIEAHLWLDGPMSSDRRVDGELRELFLDMNGIALRMPELTQEIEPLSAYERMTDVRVPTLVISGELDFPFIKEQGQYLVERIPSAKGEEIRNTAHLPNFEKPQVVNKLLRDFLG